MCGRGRGCVYAWVSVGVRGCVYAWVSVCVCGCGCTVEHYKVNVSCYAICSCTLERD